MRSSNPVFNRAEGFNGRTNEYGNTTYPGAGTGYAGYGTEPGLAPTHTVPGAADRMTIDSVVQKTGFTLGIVVLVAAATWVLSGDIVSDAGFVDNDVASRLYAISLVGALGGFALSMVNSFKKAISPALVIAFAAAEGLFVGAFSKVMEAQFGDGIVIGAVLGTMAAVGGTLAAYKILDIKVTDKFRKIVVAAMFGFVGLSVLDLVLGFFHADFGFNGFGAMGLLSSVVGLGIGILMLVLDFDFVERGIEAQLPERESWRAAFGLTVTIVWIYIELLRLLAILRGQD